MLEAMPIWLMGVFKLERAPIEVDFEERVNDSIYLLAWRVGRLGQDASDAVLIDGFDRMVQAVRRCAGAYMTAGIGRTHAGMLLGLEACRLEKMAHRAEGWRRAPRMSLRLREAAERLSHAPSAMEILARSHIRDGELWSRWGLMLTRQRKGPQAVRALGKAVRLLDGPRRVTAMRRLSDAYVFGGQFERAEDWGRRALVQAEAVGAREEEVRARYSVANAARMLGRHAESAQGMGDVAALAEERGGELKVLGIRASRTQMESLTLLCHFGEVERIGERVGGRITATTLGPNPSAPGLAPEDVLPEEAWDYANLYMAWAEAALIQERFGLARDRFQMTLRLARIHKLRSEELRAQLGMGWIALRSGEFDIADAYCRPALAELRTAEPAYVPFATCLLAELALARGDAGAAEEAVCETERAIAVCEAGYSGYPGRSDDLTWLARSVRARVLFGRGDVQGALENAEEGIRRSNAFEPPAADRGRARDSSMTRCRSTASLQKPRSHAG